MKTYEVLVTLSDKTVKKLEIDAEAPSTALRIAKGLFRGVRGLSVRRGGESGVARLNRTTTINLHDTKLNGREGENHD